MCFGLDELTPDEDVRDEVQDTTDLLNGAAKVLVESATPSQAEGIAPDEHIKRFFEDRGYDGEAVRNWIRGKAQQILAISTASPPNIIQAASEAAVMVFILATEAIEEGPAAVQELIDQADAPYSEETRELIDSAAPSIADLEDALRKALNIS